MLKKCMNFIVFSYNYQEQTEYYQIHKKCINVLFSQTVFKSDNFENFENIMNAQ